eukprot:Mrub_05366.p1 GENE.Mrub_05366~~Mrub_05366.p1  ORF type:complete len:350 (+),score=60.20 Mrub_05366:34-1050(+)
MYKKQYVLSKIDKIDEYYYTSNASRNNYNSQLSTHNKLREFYKLKSSTDLNESQTINLSPHQRYRKSFNSNNEYLEKINFLSEGDINSVSYNTPRKKESYNSARSRSPKKKSKKAKKTKSNNVYLPSLISYAQEFDYNSNSNRYDNYLNSARNKFIYKDKETFTKYISKKIVEINPEMNQKNSNLTDDVKNANKNKKSPIYYKFIQSNKLSKVNFKIFNYWYLSFKDNFKRWSSYPLYERMIKVKSIIADPNKLIQEAEPIFDLMDVDKSGALDFKEYKKIRFLLDNVTSAKLLKSEFQQMDLNNKGCISKHNFISLFKVYFEDVNYIIEHEIYLKKE